MYNSMSLLPLLPLVIRSTCNTKDGCHETPKHKPTDSGLTSNQPLQQEEEEEEEFTAGQMDPRLKTAGSFRGR